ncbi:MAG: 6-pyruvoyl-tetrahydropterin synthase-related protein [Actinomycetota bacterium]
MSEPSTTHDPANDPIDSTRAGTSQIANEIGSQVGAEVDSDTRRSEWALTLKSMTTTAIVLGATLIVIAVVQPELVLRNNTPTGGDMGAHVWGPAYLRDVLLPHWRLTGWSMDWYAGFPAYRFYMVVPALLIVLLDVVLPYGIAFKLVAVAGLVAFPACAWLMGRVAKLPYPFPELLTVGAVMFLFDESFTIYGGNIPSTMAGEFSFSISLALALAGLGMFARGLDDGKHRGWAALLIALSALSHGIVLLFVFFGAALMVLMRIDRQRLWFGITTLATAVLLSSFWVVPFLGGHAYMTDMKYEPRPSGASDSLWAMYFPLHPSLDVTLFVLALIGFAASWGRRRFLGVWMGVYSVILMIGVNVAQESLPIIGLLWNPRLLPFLYLLRYMLAAIGLWEVCVFLARAVAAQRDPVRATRAVSTNTQTGFAWVVALSCLIVLGFRYQALPGGKIVSDASGSNYAWGPIEMPAHRAFSDGWARWNFEGYEGKPAYGEYHDVVQTMDRLGRERGCGRALWENNGELNKYGTTMALMLLPHWTKSCIGSMEGLFFEAAGTTPYHFIAAAALSKQSSNPVRELRYDNNDAERGVTYMRSLGIRYYMAFTPEAIAEAKTQPDLFEVATSGPWRIYELADHAIVEPLTVEPIVVNSRPGDRRERWLEVGTSWFQHGNEWSALPVETGPAQWQRIDVAPDVERRVGEPGSSGRQVDIVEPVGAVEKRTLPKVTVTDVVMGNESVSFKVDKVGVPVVVKVSYFPTWRVDGADAVHRAAPNMLVVVPTSNEVNIHYGSPFIDRFAWFLTLVGVVAVTLFFRRRFRYGVAMPPRTPDGALDPAPVPGVASDTTATDSPASDHPASDDTASGTEGVDSDR